MSWCRRTGYRLYATALLALLSLTPASAHENLPASLLISEISADTFDVVWRVPATQGVVPELSPRLPDNCTELTPRQKVIVPAASMLRWRAHCRGGFAGQRLAIDGQQDTWIDTLLRIGFLDGHVLSRVIHPRQGEVLLAGESSAPSSSATTQEQGYFRLGIAHILSGIDHLLFVFCLVLLVPGRNSLLLTITGFTLAHSLTLALATLGMVAVPVAPIEACIALSIAFLAAELVRAKPGITVRRPWFAAFIFGLLHGFGFAGALTQAGLPADGIASALLFFNLGVEAGQLLFVAAILLLSRALATIELRTPRWIPAYVVGSAASFWLVQRMLVVLGLDLV